LIFIGRRGINRLVKTFLKILRLDFLPPGPDLALLLLRLWLGATILLNHGLDKLLNFSEKSSGFPDPLGVGNATSLGLAVFGEVVCSALLALGLLARFAALGLVITMSVAFFVVHKAVLEPGPKSGELAFIYLAGFVALLIAGPGRFSLDQMLFPKSAAPKA
jgi:putative oxidoreductase